MYRREKKEGIISGVFDDVKKLRKRKSLK